MNMTDDDLILHHFGEHPEAARIEAALAADPALAARRAALAAELAELVPAATPAPRPAALARWRASLDRAARAGTNAGTAAQRWFTPPLAAAFAVLVAVGIGVAVLPPRNAGPGQVASLGSRYESSLAWHLDETSRQLARASALPPAERSTEVARLAAQNRLYTLAAERAHEDRHARVLRSIAPLLETLADASTVNGEAAGTLSQLHFELKVMRARLAATHTAGPVLAL